MANCDGPRNNGEYLCYFNSDGNSRAIVCLNMQISLNNCLDLFFFLQYITVFYSETCLQSNNVFRFFPLPINCNHLYS